MIVVIVVAGVALLGLLGACAAAGGVAWRLIHPSAPKERLRVQGTTDTGQGSSVTLPATAVTTAPGNYGLWVDGGRTHLRLGAVTQEQDGTVTRVVECVERGALPNAGAGARWTGITHLTPSSMGLRSIGVVLHPGQGERPSWVIPGSEESRKWAIHIHGLGGQSSSVLRGIPVFQDAGYTSIAVAYGQQRSSTLGRDEWRQVDAAADYAVQHGAEEIVLVGWSMGAAIARLIVRESVHAHLVTGVLLISPSIDWRRTVQHSARGMRIPQVLARAALRIVSTPSLCRIAGLREPIDLDSMSWTDHRLGPQLAIIHGQDDRTTPHDASLELAKLAGPRLRMLSVPAATHTLEWNLDSGGCDEFVGEWLADRIREKTPSVQTP